ncbi:DUF4870 domain-containing protein [Frigoriglobus tundricola]|uniref:SHOCT domain-containing protein n=1 Tax=Frigoriglobus tundricola TaxID=2774151 RepID=A0A6M5YIM1_9BACT|nr:DUF4870 domain-containing protein [Frigoriglobus tundricola]QJW93394.1 hypothetical protein FTUN_0900 [Frigoriglobus tundricola]
MSLTDELNKLKQLHDDGTITNEQYERARAKLLDPEVAHEIGEERPRCRRREEDEDDEEREARPRRRRREEDDEDEEYGLRRSARRKKVNEWAMLLHLSMFAGHVIPFGGIIAPIVLWQMKKDEWPEIDEHGKNAVNWIISFIIYLVISGILCLILVGFVLLLVLVVLGVVFPIIAAVKANDGKVWRYPLTIQFLS